MFSTLNTIQSTFPWGNPTFVRLDHVLPIRSRQGQYLKYDQLEWAWPQQRCWSRVGVSTRNDQQRYEKSQACSSMITPSWICLACCTWCTWSGLIKPNNIFANFLMWEGAITGEMLSMYKYVWPIATSGRCDGWWIRWIRRRLRSYPATETQL